jgi:Ca-activated chloride channel family protein
MAHPVSTQFRRTIFFPPIFFRTTLSPTILCSTVLFSAMLPGAILVCALTWTGGEAWAQSAIDDVHVAIRNHPMEVAAAAYPATPVAGGFAGTSLIRTSADLVMVPVSITDDFHRPVLGLDQDNFQLFEGKKRQEIKNFSSEDTPISVGIILDVSRSMSYKLERAREAVAAFCDQANPEDEYFLITFADAPRLETDFTNSSAEIENDLLTVRSKGMTSLLDAIEMGLKKMKQARYGRKALLILSDGGDNHSRHTERAVKSAIKESDVMIYAVGTYDRYVATQEEMLGPELLRTVTSLTGGQAYTLTNENDLPKVTRNIGVQLRHQYVLAYQPQLTQKDGKWRKVSVKLRLPKKLRFLHVDARPGYYAGGE